MSGVLCATLFALGMQAGSKEAALSGIVLDKEGRAVVGARVDIASAAPRTGRGVFCPSCYRDCRKWTRTDRTGRFRFTGLDPSLRFRLLCTAPSQRPRITDLADPRDGELKITLDAKPRDLPPERTIRGRVVDDLGVPIPGALVEPAGGKDSERRWYGRVPNAEPSVTDVDGRFTMPIARGYVGIDVRISADGHAGGWVPLLRPGADEHRIVVPAGTRVTGRLVHAGKPVGGLHVAVVQLDRSTGRHFIKAVDDTTDRKGRFVFDCLPTDEDYAIYSVVGNEDQHLVLTTKRFRAGGNRKERDLGTLEAIPALQLRGRLEIADGQSLPRDVKFVLDRDPAWDLISVPVGKDGRFHIGGLPPETYEVRVVAEGLEIDWTHLTFQSLGLRSFGIRLTESIEDLRIPLKRARRQ